MNDPILAGIQAALDSEGDGWHVGAYVVIVGCERIIDGRLECKPFHYQAPGQPRCVTNGLLAEELQDVSEEAD